MDEGIVQYNNKQTKDINKQVNMRLTSLAGRGANCGVIFLNIEFKGGKKQKSLNDETIKDKIL